MSSSGSNFDEDDDALENELLDDEDGEDTGGGSDDPEGAMAVRHILDGAAASRAPGQHPSFQKFSAVLKRWDEARAAAGFDPTSLLEEMAEVMEQEASAYQGRDNDPYEDRHPSRVNPECQYGHLLKAFLKKDSLVQDLFNNYLHDKYFHRQGRDTNPNALNAAALRLTLSVLPGLESGQLSETDSLISRLFGWAEQDEEEPLRSYATGVLAAAMESPETVTDADFRERNHRLVPVLLRRLRGWTEEMEEERRAKRAAFKRPFAVFAAGQDNVEQQPRAKVPRRLSREVVEQEANKAPQVGVLPAVPPSPRRNSLSEQNSNSSWAEMEPHIIGHCPLHPLTRKASMILTLKLLTPLAEYQEFLSVAPVDDLVNIIRPLVKVQETLDARLAFEAIRFLVALFCHKKLVTEWVSRGGIELLLEVPRPSVAATAVSQALFFLSADDHTMEKVCCMRQQIIVSLVKYVLWCMECSHESGRQFSTMFFGSSSTFPAILDAIDNQDGLRRLFNTISTLKILNHGENSALNMLMSEEEEQNQRQSLRHANMSFKRYFESHLAAKCDELRGSNSAPRLVQSASKPVRTTAAQLIEQVNHLMQIMPFRLRWPAVDEFVKLGGVQTLLKIIAMAYDWTFPGRAEMVKSALDVLYICSVMPRVQFIICEQLELHDESKTTGMNIILSAAEGEIVQESAEVRRSALNLIINCVCAPIYRPGCSRAPAPTGGAADGAARKKGIIRNSEDLINKVWNCVRSNNGIMALIELLHTKTPITDADSIRALACHALVGLARSTAAKQIMSKLPIISSGQLQQLAREPILQDKRAEHVKFQRHAHELMQIISAGDDVILPGTNDLSLEMLHRANVIAQTKISFPKKQLLQLIQDYLGKVGMHESALVLKREASLDLMKTPKSKLMLHRSVPPSTSSSQSQHNPPAPQSGMHLANGFPTPSTSRGSPVIRSLSFASPTVLRTVSSPLPTSASPTPHSSSSFQPNGTAHQTPTVSSRLAPQATPENDAHTTPSSISGSASISFRINRRNMSSRIQGEIPTFGPTTPLQEATPRVGNSNLMKACESKANLMDTQDEEQVPVDLVSIVCDYLAGQHRLCKNPMATCPEFDLFLPHKCPDPRPKHSAPWNITTRLTRRSLCPPFGGPDGRRLDRHLLHSRFRPIKAIRLEQGSDSGTYTSCAIMPDDSYVLAGTYAGEVKMFNLANPGEEHTYNAHESTVYHIQPSRDSNFLLTSSAWRTPYSCLWSLGEWFDSKMTFREDEYVEFSKARQDKVIGTKNEVASIYDIEAGKKLREMRPNESNSYTRNKATFDHTDDLVLTDGVLYDVRMEDPIRKLDKLNQHLSGVFHPNGMEIVSNSEIWDLRTFQLQKTVPGLDRCQVIFNPLGDVMYALSLETEDDDGEKFDSAFKTVDATDYSSIATIETRRAVLDLCPSFSGLMLAAVENSLSPSQHEESVVRLYDVGRGRHDDEEDGDGDEGAADDEDGDGNQDSEDGGFDYTFLSDDDDDGDEFDDLLDDEDGGGADDEDDDEDDDDEDDEEEDAEDEDEAGQSGRANRAPEGRADDLSNASEEEEPAGSHSDNDPGGGGGSNSDDSWEDMEREEIIGE